jgi:hypothetical protein
MSYTGTIVKEYPMDAARFTQLIDDTLQRELDDPSEEELIEIVNKYEYQLENEAGKDRKVRARRVKLLHDHLARRQSGKLDRFGLRDVSSIELKHRLDNLEAELKAFVGSYKPPTSFVDRVVMSIEAEDLPFQLFVKKKLLLELRLQLDLRNHAVSVRPSPPSPAELATQKAKAALEKISALQVACDETIKQTPPDLQDDIRRVYQKQIDRIRTEDL